MTTHHSPAPGVSQTPTKAVIAAVVAFLGTLVATLSGREDLDSTQLLDWVIVVCSALVAGLATYSIPNKAT